MAHNKKRIMAPRTMARPGWDLLAARDDVEAVPYAPDMPTPEFHALLAEADGVALALTPFGGPEVAAAPRLRVAARIGVGYDAVDVPTLTSKRLPLMTAGTANSVTVAEHAFFMMLALAKKSVTLDTMVREGRWAERFQHLPYDLAGKTILVVGFGRIGTRVVKRCLAFEMTVLVHDPYVDKNAVKKAGATSAPDLDTAIPTADFITIHCPKNRETTNLIDARRLALMKPTAFLINIARGQVIDEDAIFAALRDRTIGGAALDVWWQYPTAAEPNRRGSRHPFHELPNVIVTPHNSGWTSGMVRRRWDEVALNLRRFAAGEELINLVTTT